ncbi:hypothetical protein OICFNHDK_3168 [Methylobacterium bullatum]|uniref:Membrane-associated oxidoreductase n=1 Tax=Methylobacterium bullatum TaxID=570505 RepID=A0AAV4Z9V7_9HYPH|nr:hypothetical protein [Methylobacterium bullatum]MBD8901805.1 hypothetical protein [Methylobacterium bullatum]GJD40695.1 hypothetical protein OICFNHDK_3168 [Methylobacterium bullatum]
MHEAAQDAIGELTDPEHRLVEAGRAGDILRLAPGEAIRASVIRALVCAERTDWPVAPEGVRLVGGRVLGLLACADRYLVRPLWIDDAEIPDGIDISNSHTRTLSFEKSRIGNGLSAQGVTIAGPLFISHATFTGTCDISGASIASTFTADGAVFDHPNGDAINAQRSSMAGSFLNHAAVKGGCRFLGATIRGQFVAVGAVFDNPAGDAIDVQDITVAGIFLDGATIMGTCHLVSAHIAAQFAAEGATFHQPNGTAINAQGSRIGSVILRGGVGPDNVPIPSTINGGLNFSRATVEHHFEISGGTLTGGPSGALDGRGIETKGRFIIGRDAYVTGAILLSGVEIRGSLDLSGSHILSSAIAQDTYGESAHGVASFEDDPLRFVALDLSESNISHLIMPDATDMRYPGCGRPRGIVDLSRLKVGTYVDFASAWPVPVPLRRSLGPDRFRDAKDRDADHLILDGFEYQHLDNPDGDAVPSLPTHTARQRWLRGQSRDDLFTRLRPQPWRHLAKVLASQGYEEDAHRIAIARRVAERHARETGWFLRCINWLLHVLADYGFNPWKAVGWSVVVIVVWAAVYTGAAFESCKAGPRLCQDGEIFVRTAAADFVPGVTSSDEARDKLVNLYPAFDPLAYSFDTFMPLFDAGTDRFWRVNTATWRGVALYYFSIAEQIEGAVLVSLIITGFTGLLTRDEA